MQSTMAPSTLCTFLARLVARLTACVGLLVVQAASAYQTDFHYGLTFWLSRQAGFDVQQAHDIARANEATDIGDLDAVHAMVAHVCSSLDTAVAEQSSRTTRDNHFRSQKDVPNPPELRGVDPHAAFAAMDVNRWISETGIDPTERLLRVGRALHGWQDTYSHGGTPDSTVVCRRKEYFWSHPHARGGAYRTEADLTASKPENVELCIAAAESSYRFLERFRKEAVPNGTSRPWRELNGPARDFCGGSTKTAKFQWLQTQGVPQADAIVARTSLDNGERRFNNVMFHLNLLAAQAAPEPVRTPYYASREREGDLMHKMGLLVAAVAQPPVGTVRSMTAPVNKWFESFLREWLTAPPDRMQEVASRYFDAGFRSPAQNEELLWRWRLLDRGAAERAPRIERPTVQQMEFFSGAASGSWLENLVPVRGLSVEQPFLMVEPVKELGRAYYTAHVILRHAPQNILLLEVAPRGQSFGITGWHGLISH